MKPYLKKKSQKLKIGLLKWKIQALSSNSRTTKKKIHDFMEVAMYKPLIGN
jgi:hypothetical protein